MTEELKQSEYQASDDTTSMDILAHQIQPSSAIAEYPATSKEMILNGKLSSCDSVILGW